MKKVFLETGQRFFESVLAWLQDGKEESDVNRRNDFSDAGILSGVGEDFDIIIGDNNNPPTTHSINVRPGVSYDINGERIEITDPISAFDPSAPTSTSSDGRGGTVITPQSTGSQNITLTANSLNFIWLDYLAIRDTSEFTLHKVTNAKQYFKQDDGFQIIVTTVDVAPTLASLKLGSVDLTGGGIVSPATISLANRVFSGIKVSRMKIKVGKLDRSDATLSYNHEDELFVNDHMKALGDGILSEKNPHALTALNIGLNTEEILETHQKFMHSNGIIGDPASTTTSLFLELVPATPGEDFVRIKLIDTDELALVDGFIVTNSDIPSDVTLLFSSVTDPTNTYYVFINKNTKQVQRSDINPAGDNTKLPLWSFTWTANLGAPNDGNITNIVDLRDFSTTVFPLFAPNGSASDPVYSFNESQSTGIFSGGADRIDLSNNGVNTVTFNTTDMDSALRFRGPDGSAAAPAFSFTGDTDTGILRNGENNLGISAGGTVRLSITSGSVVVGGVPFRADAGNASAPGIAFQSDQDTGWFNNAVDTLDGSVGGTRTLTIDSSGIRCVAGVFRAPDADSVTNPGYSWNADQDTGMFRAGADQIGFSTNATARLIITTGELQIFNSVITNTDGTNTNPSYSFFGDTNTGMYKAGVNQIGFSTNGTARLIITTGELQISNAVITNTDGTNTNPSYSFGSDSNTGMYNAGVDQIGFATNATARLIITTGELQISNAVITNTDGTNANPSYSFGSDSNTGMYRAAEGQIGFSANTSVAALITSSGLQTVDNGYKFLTSSNLGMEKSGTTLRLRTASASNPFFIVDSGEITSNANHNFLNTGIQVVGNTMLPILQVVTATTNTETATSSVSFTNTNLSVTISPKFSTSKILVLASGNFTQDAGATGFATIARNGVNLAPSNTGFHASISNNNYHINMNAYDSPGTTGSTIYTVQIRREPGGAFSRFPVSNGVGTGAAQITVIELAQ